MKLRYEGLCLRIFVLEALRQEHKPLYEFLILRAHTAGLAGASAFHSIEGFGAHHHRHTDRFIETSDNMPIVVEIVDRPERIREFVDALDGVIDHGMITVSPVRVVTYSDGSQQ